MDARFAREARRGKRNREIRVVGDGKRDFGCCGSVRVVQGEDTRRAVALDRATVVGVHEGTDEEGGEERAKSQKSDARSKRSPMRQAAHHDEGTPMALRGQASKQVRSAAPTGETMLTNEKPW